MGGKNTTFRATVIHEAAKVVQDHFRHWGISSAVGADLIWYLLLDSPGVIKEWKLDIYIRKYRGSVSSVAHRLAAIDSRFSILRSTPTVIVYTHNVLHDGSLLKKRSCDISLIDAPWLVTVTQIEDVTCFPFRRLLFERMKIYPTISSATELRRHMLRDLAASKAILASKIPIRFAAEGFRAKDEAEYYTLLERLCNTVPDAEDALYSLQIARRDPVGEEVPGLAVNKLEIADDIVSPVIPTGGFRAVVFRAAKEVTRILHEAGYTIAILGSTACYLYGNGRLPNDLDILVSSQVCDPEELKKLLVTTNPNHFYLVDAKAPEATWKVLWYRDRGGRGKFDKTKVDILKPGILHLPMIFSEAIVEKQGLPVIPMSILLLHKLQGWKDNTKSSEMRLWSKHKADAGDVCSLLRILFAHMSEEEKKNSVHWKCFALERFDEEFRDATKNRVAQFCNQYPAQQEMWQKLGW